MIFDQFDANMRIPLNFKDSFLIPLELEDYYYRNFSCCVIYIFLCLMP